MKSEPAHSLSVRHFCIIGTSNPAGEHGIKLYLTHSGKKTIEELSKAVGTATMRIVTRSRTVRRNPFAGCSISERTEETVLPLEDEARRMDLDDLVLVVDAQMSVCAKRIRFYEYRFLKGKFDKQASDLPYLSAGDQVRCLQGQFKAIEARIGALEAPSGPVSQGALGSGKRREEIDEMSSGRRDAPSGEKLSLSDYQAGTGLVARFMEKASGR